MLAYTIAEHDHCRSVESFLRNILPAASHAYLRKLLKAGHLTINDAPAILPEMLLRLDDVLTLKESVKTVALLAEAKPALEVLHEDHWIMAFNKPPGLPMHRAAEVDENNLVDLGSKLLAARDSFPGKLRPVNRLDRGTSGVVVLAKSSSAAGMFGRFVKEEGLQKVYLAVVQGELSESGEINLPLEGKEAQTRFTRLYQGRNKALAAVYPVTGRMHQIRIHFNSVGNPIVGDVRYGGRLLSGYSGILLHSFRTSLTHPGTGEKLTVHAPLPAGFVALIKELSGDDFSPLFARLPDIP